ncbi:hypothetical protein Taro_012413 [Colocasia esculenta]|uniref:Uncharacterized protein n=1 Tax=Colocasia esculenta TaxID=4460 RepID=A0A843UDI9_COLES|nr:hypothetical protein [Colocasia esculenta]
MVCTKAGSYYVEIYLGLNRANTSCCASFIFLSSSLLILSFRSLVQRTSCWSKMEIQNISIFQLYCSLFCLHPGMVASNHLQT